MLIDDLVFRAKLNVRLRLHHNFHTDFAESVQRFANAIDMNSYIRPHRNGLDPKLECLIALKGIFAAIIFDDQGLVYNIIKFGSESYIKTVPNYGVNISAEIWHTVIALTPNSVLFESKSGPFEPLSAKEFASWAPSEGSSEAVSYLENLRNSIGDS